MGSRVGSGVGSGVGSRVGSGVGERVGIDFEGRKTAMLRLSACRNLRSQDNGVKFLIEIGFDQSGKFLGDMEILRVFSSRRTGLPAAGPIFPNRQFFWYTCIEFSRKKIRFGPSEANSRAP